MAPLSQSEADRVTEIAAREKKTRRAQYRPSDVQRELLVRAASLTGQSLSDFMRTAIEERAQRVIADHERIILSNDARNVFLTALIAPPPANDRLIQLMEKYAREVKSRP